MRTFCLALVALFALAFTSSARAEPVFPDALLDEYLLAAKSLATGGDREDTLARLRREIEKHPHSPHMDLAARLARDLAVSVEKAAARTKAGRSVDDAPAEFLSETKVPLYLLAFPENWDPSLRTFMTEHARDPAVLLLKQERKCIDSLLSQLSDDSPTRVFDDSSLGGVPAVPRVSDVALNLIETVSRCEFSSGYSTPAYLHGQSAGDREKIIQHVAQWWRENRDKSIAEGIRAQLPYGDFYSQITMAKSLIRLAGETSPDDREHGLEVLRRLARSGADDRGSAAAVALAKYGDLSPVEWYYTELKNALHWGRELGHSIPAMFYLAAHGSRKEWELLYKISERDLEQSKEPWRAPPAVLGSMMNAPTAKTSPFAIPLLGLGLSRTEAKGSRWINEQIGGQSFSTADLATEYLQIQTGIDFGYRIEGTPQKRATAIERAQKWWAEEGKAKYTFDYIEKKLGKPHAGKNNDP